MLKTLTLLFVTIYLANGHMATDGVGVVIIFSGGVPMEVVTTEKTCQGASSVPKLPLSPSGPNEGCAAEYVDDKYFLCGGSDINFSANCYSFTIGSTVWQDAGELSDSREFAASLVFNGEMMILGGYNDRAGWLDSVEKKVAGTNIWELMEPWTLPRKIFHLCADQVDENRIIIVGGNQYGVPYVDNVDILDATTNTWTPADPLSEGKAYMGCMTVEYQGERGLLVTGGCTDSCQDHVDTVEFFSYTTNTWQLLPSLNEKRMGHKMAWVDGMPAVIGGYDISLKAKIELFDGEQWIFHPSKLSTGGYILGLPRYIPKDKVTCP